MGKYTIEELKAGMFVKTRNNEVFLVLSAGSWGLVGVTGSGWITLKGMDKDYEVVEAYIPDGTIAAINMIRSLGKKQRDELDTVSVKVLEDNFFTYIPPKKKELTKSQLVEILGYDFDLIEATPDE